MPLGNRIYSDYNEMLAKEDLDIVSVCTWPHRHAQMVIDCANAGVKAIHGEKPMAPTYGEAKAMVKACEANGVQLTFNHQRRFGAPYQMARSLAQSGAIGELTRLEGTCPDLFDWGTHWFDMMFFYNNETPAEWVIGQVGMRAHRVVFGVTLEGQGLSHVRFANGVEGILMTNKLNIIVKSVNYCRTELGLGESGSFNHRAAAADHQEWCEQEWCEQEWCEGRDTLDDVTT